MKLIADNHLVFCAQYLRYVKILGLNLKIN